jgi:E3 ubiquitin-protein ligase mind-bomb
MICSDSIRDTLLKPCNHIIGCNVCSSRCKKCLLCKEAIEDRIKIDECHVCSEKKSSILLQPCGHMCTCADCSKLLKKCIKCREVIEKKTPYYELCTVNTPKESILTPSNSFLNRYSAAGLEEDEDKTKDLKKLQQQLEDIKEQVRFC